MTDDELIEAVAKVMAENNVKERQDWSKLTKEQKGWWLSDAKYALAVARPIIEAPLRAENEKLRAAGLELVSQTIAAQQAEIEKLRAILFQFAAYDDGYESADCGAMTVITVPIGVIRAAAAALKETGDE